MKHIKLLWVLGLLVLFQNSLLAQSSDKINIQARVLGALDEPIADAVVSSEADNLSVVTDSTGAFNILVSPGAVLSVEAPSYVTKIVSPESDLALINLTRDGTSQGVRVAYRDVEESNLMGGVSHIDMQSLLEKNYISYSLSNMAGLVPGFHGNLWGYDEFLVLVDGVPRDATSVLPVEIDQISFLKGVAAVALYGSRAAKGVVLISTKRGAAGDNTIRVRTNSGINVPKSYPRFLGSGEYMDLYNEARANDGLSPLYSEEDIYNHASGINPYRYPNVDYYSSDYLQEVYSSHDAIVEITGGNERAKYYTNIGFVTEGSVLDFGAAEDNRNNRFNIRGNVDVNINRNISAQVDAAALYYTGRGVNADFWGGAATLRPHRFSPLIPIDFIEANDQESLNLIENSENIIDGKYFLGGSQLDQTNPIADIYAGGTSVYNSRQFQFNTAVNADLSDLLEGLNFTTRFGIDYATTYSLSFNNEYAVFAPIWNNYNGADQIGTLTKFGQDASTGDQNIGGSWYRQTLSMSSMLSYNNTFNKDHQVSALLMAGGFQRSTVTEYHREGNANLGLHLGYTYKNKYYAEFTGALVHSARLPEDNRQAISPTASLGWRISNEGFLAGSSTINNLKLHVSGGILHTDLDINDYYLYESIYRQTDGAWYTWKDGLQNQSTDSRRGANPNMTYPKREEVSLGLDAGFFDNKLVFTGSLFASRMTGLIIQNNALFPSYFVTGFPNSSFIPYVNYDNDQRTGFDFNLQLNQSLNEVDFTIGLVGTYYTTEATKRAENFEDEYQNRQGRPLDGIWGLENDGFFMDQAEIDNSPEQAFGEVRPGDIKYKDQNGDDVINAQDEVYLGKGGWFGSPFTTGLNLTAKWRNLTFFALGILQTGGNAMRNSDYFWVSGEDKYPEVVRDRWTEETKNTATYPRLTTLNGNNNFRSSDFWLYSTNRFDLSRVQVSYNFPSSVLGNGWFEKLGVYVNGANLLTVSPNREILEMNVYSAPQTRFFNLGVTAQF